MGYEDKAQEAEARVVADVVTKARTPEIIALSNGVQVAYSPPGTQLTSLKALLDEYLKAPERMKGTALLFDAKSFIAWVVRFKDGDSVVFANPKDPSLTAVIDYHRAVNVPATSAVKPKKTDEPIALCSLFEPRNDVSASPRFGEHVGSFTLALSPEWLSWTGKSGKWLTSSEFASWLEDRIADVRAPTTIGQTAALFLEQLSARFASPQELMKLSKGMEVRQRSVVKDVRVSESGEANVTYVNEHQDESGAPLKVPTAFLIALRVFDSGAPWEICVRLRYRVAGQSISWAFELYRTDKILELAFKEECEHVQHDTGLPLFVGTPE